MACGLCHSIRGIHSLGVCLCSVVVVFFFSSRRRHTRCLSDWSSDVCSSDLSPRQPAVRPPPSAPPAPPTGKGAPHRGRERASPPASGPASRGAPNPGAALPLAPRSPPPRSTPPTLPLRRRPPPNPAERRGPCERSPATPPTSRGSGGRAAGPRRGGIVSAPRRPGVLPVLPPPGWRRWRSAWPDLRSSAASAGVERRDALHHILALRLAQLRIQGQRQHLCGGALALREQDFAKTLEAGLAVQRHRVVHRGTDPVGLQVLPQRLALLVAHGGL